MYNLSLPIYVLFYVHVWTDYTERVLPTVSSHQLSDWPTAECLLRTVLYDAFYSYLCRCYWNGILGPSKDMNLDNILQQQSFLGPVLPHYVPPIPTPVVGAELLGTDKNSLVVYDPLPWIPRPMELYMKPGMEGLLSRPFDYIPSLSLKQLGVCQPTLD